jgi:dinuclear metal center YbgI/SA1388 family protein
MHITDLLRALGDELPLQSAGYEKDAIGLQIGLPSGSELTKALVAYEVTEDIVAEAEKKGANLIVSYHPLIFPNISSITDSTRTGMLTARLIRSGIALYVVHTALDSDPLFGTSRLMADALGLKNVQPLHPLGGLLEKIVVFVPYENLSQVQEAMWNAGAGSIGNYDECSFIVNGEGTFRGGEDTNPSIGTPLVREKVNEVRLEMICEKWKTARIVNAMKEAHLYEEVAFDVYPLANKHPKFGMGTLGELPKETDLTGLLATIKSSFSTQVLRHNGITGKFRKVALVGGSGMEYYSAAKGAGAEVLVTADIRYHDFYRAFHDNILLVDAGHAETERFVSAGLMEIVQKAGQRLNLSDETARAFVIESSLKPNRVVYYS